MSKFFINRPIVAMVISILFVLLGHQLLHRGGLGLSLGRQQVAQAGGQQRPVVRCVVAHRGRSAISYRPAEKHPDRRSVAIDQ